MGGGGLTAISTFLASDLVPLRKRGMWQGFGNLCFGLGSGLGGIFGGWMNDTWGWRWAFLLQLPFILVSTVLVIIHVNVPVKETDMSRWKRIDFLGAATLVITLVMFLLGLSTGGNQFPWTHPFVLTTLSLSAVGFLGFLYVEDAVASEPVIPVRLLLDRTVFAACLTNWFTTMSVFAILIYMPLYLQVQGYSATMAGVRLVSQAAGAAVGSLALESS
jgi:MFS family permease